MRSLRAWDDQLEKMLYANIEKFDDMLGYRFSEHFETDKPIYQWGTGLKDNASDEEWYEGDILTPNPHSERTELEVICFDIHQGKYKSVPVSLYKTNAGNGGWTGYDVKSYQKRVGNVHEHPHLLNLPGEVDHD